MTITTQNAAPGAVAGGLDEELHALTGACGVYRPERALFSVSGKDRVRWLNGMVSNNIRDLATGHGVYAFVLNAQGQIQGDLYAFNRGETLTLEIGRSQVETLRPLLRRYIIMDKVEIQELADIAIIGIAGPKSSEALSSFGIAAMLAPLQVADLPWSAGSLTLVHGDNSCVANYELWASAAQADALVNALEHAGATVIQNEKLEAFRILCGVPKFGQDIRERTLPQETGQDRALNFNKGCYIGQEIVERIRARGTVHRAFTGFEVDGIPAPGTKIQSEGKDVGEITSVLPGLANGGRSLALGYLRREAISPERDLKADSAMARVRTLPFAELHSQ
jgi:folate-binding protein YgfZ